MTYYLTVSGNWRNAVRHPVMVSENIKTLREVGLHYNGRGRAQVVEIYDEDWNLIETRGSHGWQAVTAND